MARSECHSYVGQRPRDPALDFLLGRVTDACDDFAVDGDLIPELAGVVGSDALRDEVPRGFLALAPVRLGHGCPHAAVDSVQSGSSGATAKMPSLNLGTCRLLIRIEK